MGWSKLIANLLVISASSTGNTIGHTHAHKFYVAWLDSSPRQCICNGVSPVHLQKEAARLRIFEDVGEFIWRKVYIQVEHDQTFLQCRKVDFQHGCTVVRQDGYPITRIAFGFLPQESPHGHGPGEDFFIPRGFAASVSIVFDDVRVLVFSGRQHPRISPAVARFRSIRTPFVFSWSGGWVPLFSSFRRLPLFSHRRRRHPFEVLVFRVPLPPLSHLRFLRAAHVCFATRTWSYDTCGTTTGRLRRRVQARGATVQRPPRARARSCSPTNVRR